MTLKELKNILPQKGKVEWIGIRPEKRAELNSVQNVQVDLQNGLVGDHYGKAGGNRQVTLIQAEHLQTVSHILQKEAIDPHLTRRNIVVSGINLLAFKDQQFQVGDVVLEMTGLCHPCSRMEENLGPGGYNAMRGHGGITAKVVQEGTIRVGDEVGLLVPEQSVK
jgi:MOSC domain-containing protein YiiM